MSKITAYGNITITDLSEPFSVLLSNEAQQFAVDSSRKVTTVQSYYTDIIVYQGTTQRTDYTIGSITVPSGITVSKTSSRVTFSVALGVTLSTDTGTITIPIMLDGNTVNKTFSWSCAKQGIQGITGETGKNALQPVRNFGGTYTTIGIMTTLNTDDFNRIPVVGDVFTNIDGSSNTGTWKVTAVSGTTVTIQLLSYVNSKGATGASAKSVDITATTQIFKSTDGGQTFSPDTIKLTPVLQGGLTFSKWQYSINGGTSWTDVSSGANGLTVSSNVLTISKKSTLFTDTITSLVFKCLTNNSSFYDVMTVIRLYDVTDIKFGGRNLILNSKGDKKEGFFKNFQTVTDEYGEITLKSKKTYAIINITDGFLLGCRDYTVGEQVTWSYDIMYTSWNFPDGTNRNEFWMGQRYTNAPSGQTATGSWRSVTVHKLPVVGENNCELNKWYHVEATLTIPEQASENVGTISSIQFYNSNANIESSFTARFKNLKLEKGNKATDWTPAPEDIDNQFKETKNSITNLSTTVNNQKLEIQNKIGKTDLMTVTDSDGKVVKKTVADTLTQATQDINGFKKEVFQKYTTKAENSQTLTDAKSYADQTVNGFKSTVENTYTKITDFNNLRVGGRNLAQKTSNDYSTPYSRFDGSENTCPAIGKVLTDGLSVGDTVTVRLIYKYTNIVAASGETASFWIQGSGNVTEWNTGAFLSCPIKTITGSGECEVLYNFKVTANHLKNSYWMVTVRHDYVQSGSVQWKMFKVEKGTTATDWTPAPEDIDNSISSVKSYAEQTENKFKWLIDDSSTQTSITMTPNLVTAITKQYVIKDSSGSATIIEGGKIKANSITSDMLSATAIKSQNYKAGTYKDGAGYSTLGTLLELDTGMIHTPGFYTDSLGNTFVSGEIHAYTGYFGSSEHNWFLGETTLTDIMNDDGALTNGNYSYLKATNNTAIIAGNWHLMAQSSDMAMRSGFTTLNGGNFVKNPVDGKYYDFGVVEPDMTKEAKEYNKKFLYIRRANSSQTHPQDWEYLFRVDYDGSIWYKGKLIAGEGGMFLSITGGTITGDLKVNGTLTATASAAKKVTNALTINGKSFDGSSAVNVGIIGTAYGGTGSSTVSGARANLSVLGTKNANGYYGLTKPDGTDSDWIRTTSNGILPYKSGSSSSLGTSAWHFSQAYIDTVYGNLDGLATKATQDASGNVITDTYMRKDVSEINQNITFNNSVNIEDLTTGSLLVNGNARFINGIKGNLVGDVTGNLSGIASQATKLQTARKIGNASFDGTSDLTLSQIGASSSGHTHNYAGSSSAGGAATSANKLNVTTSITTGADQNNITGYRLLSTINLNLTWCDYRAILLVKGRHAGTGILSIGVGNNSSTISRANVYGEICYYGIQNSGSAIITNSYLLYVSADGKTAYLFGQYRDYGETSIYVITSDFPISNGTWMTSISESTYGTQLANTQINSSSWSAITGKPSTFTPSEHDHNYILDSGDSRHLTMSYSKAGLEYDSYTWLAAWNGNELRAVNKSQFARSGHNHDISSLTNFGARVYDAKLTRTANTFLAAPNGSNGTASFRKIEVADLPSHTHSYVSKITLAGTAYNVSSNNITITKDNLISAIGVGTTSETSPTVAGLMTKAERDKLASITVSDIGTVGANSIKGTAPIGVSITKGVATLTHGTSGVTSGSYGADSTNYFRIPKLTVDSRGHVTSASYYDITGANLASRIGSNTIQNATNATKAIQDASGNVITDTYLRKDFDTINQNVIFSNSVNIEDLTAGSLLVNGNARFVNGIKGNLVGDVTGNLSGNANTATVATKANLLANLFSNRPTDANITITGSGGVATFKATSTMTSNKPPTEGAHILHFYWDNRLGWDSQLALGLNGHLYTRSQNEENWTSWKTVLDDSNYTSYAPKKDGTGATGTWGINITGNAPTATKWQTARSLTIGNTKKSVNGSVDVSWSLSEIGALPLSGGKMTGNISWDSNSLPQFSGAPKYLVGIEAFADGGTMKWNLVDNIQVGLATKATTADKATKATSADKATTADSATKATQDASGNVITTKYVAVDTTQTITGAKTFNSVLTVTNTTTSTSKITGALKVKGGVGVEGQMSANKVMVGDKCTLQMDEYGSLNFVFV